MKTKNEIGDWLRAVKQMEKGASLEDATRGDATLVRKRTNSVRQTRLLSRGQIRAIRRE